MRGRRETNRGGRGEQGECPIPSVSSAVSAVKIRLPRNSCKTKVVREGLIDLVAVGRERLRDADWAAKAAKALGKVQAGPGTATTFA